MAKRREETFEEVFTEAGIIPEWMERGRVQGLEKGMVQGLEQGLEKGKKIIAQNMLKMGMSDEKITQAVELPEVSISVKKFSMDAYWNVVIRANPRVFLERYNEAKNNGRKGDIEEIFTEAGIIPEWIERGREQGVEQGRKHGLEQGFEKGKEIFAQNMLIMGMSVEEVAQITELPVKEIRALPRTTCFQKRVDFPEKK
jgi:predicted transposase YdaD